MTNNIQFLTDNKGRKTSVIIPYSDWEEINIKYKKLLNKVHILTSIKESLLEIKHSKRTGNKLKLLSDFLNEN